MLSLSSLLLKYKFILKIFHALEISILLYVFQTILPFLKVTITYDCKKKFLFSKESLHTKRVEEIEKCESSSLFKRGTNKYFRLSGSSESHTLCLKIGFFVGELVHRCVLFI